MLRPTEQLVILCLLGLSFGCSQPKTKPSHLSQPVPVPVAPVVDPAPTPPPPVAAPGVPPAPPPSMSPVWSLQPPIAAELKETETFKLQLTAKSPAGLPLSYFFQCPYLCPSGVQISQAGLVTWATKYGDGGRYDITWVATDTTGASTLSGPMVITVAQVHRTPTINSIQVVPDNAAAPRSLTCVVTKDNPGGDPMFTTRSWQVNGSPQAALSGQTVATTTMLPGDQVTCSAVVDTGFVPTVGPALSAAFQIPRHAPTLTSVAVETRVPGSASPAVFRVGDQVGCGYVASSVDQNATIVRQKTTLYSAPPGATTTAPVVLAQDDSGNDVSYVVKKTDAHQMFSCVVTVGDSVNSSTGSSTATQVTNSAPQVLSLLVVPSAGAGVPVQTGDQIKCLVTYQDPDGDLVAPAVGFLNGTTQRGPGSLISITQGTAGGASTMTSSYQLLTSQQAQLPNTPDTAGSQMGCGVTLTDPYGGAVTATTALSLTVAPKAPTLTLSQVSVGPLTQSLKTGEASLPITMLATQLDGDQMVIGALSDTCSALGIQVLVTQAGLIPSFTIPAAAYPQADRSCTVTVQATDQRSQLTSGAVTVSLQITNHAPQLSCTDQDGTYGSTLVTRRLRTGVENYKGQMVQAGQQLGTTLSGATSATEQVRCKILDQDGSVVGQGGKTFDVQLSNDGCSAQPWDIGGQSTLTVSQVDPTTFLVNGAMGTRACSVTITAKDGNVVGSLGYLGSLVSNTVQLNLVPLIDAGINDAATMLDNACYLTMQPTSYGGPGEPASSSPLFNGGFSYSSASAAFNGAQSVDPSTLQVDQYGLSGLLSQAHLSTDYAATGVVIDWTLVALGAGNPQAQVTRNLQRKYLAVETALGTSTQTPQRSLMNTGAGASFAVTKGTQVAQSGSCLNAAKCSGLRASIAAGASHTCVVSSFGGTPGTLCWGDDSFGQLGDQVAAGNYSATPTPVLDLAGIPLGTQGSVGTLTQVAAGGHFSCGVTTAGNVACWGDGSHGQLGMNPAAEFPQGCGSITSACGGAVLVPTSQMAPQPLGGVALVTTGSQHACALMSDSTVVCWGDDSYGELGRPALTGMVNGNRCGIYPCEWTPGSVVGPDGVNNLSGIVSLSSGGQTTCALNWLGATYCWGRGGYGQLGTGSYQNSQMASSPADSALPLLVQQDWGSGQQSALRGLSVGQRSSCGVTPGGATYCWGNGLVTAQLGFGQQAQLPAPSGLNASYTGGVAASEQGADFGCSLLGSGTVDCYGANDHGETGGGTITAAPVAQKVPVMLAGGQQQLGSVVAMTAGDHHACAVLISGKVACWGANESGQLGIGNTVDSAYARLVSGGAPLGTTQQCQTWFQLQRQ